MKVSTKGRYGLRLMFDLAVHYNEGLLPLKEIARQEDISSKYLEQIVMQLDVYKRQRYDKTFFPLVVS